MAWSKARALEYVDQGDPGNALASLASDVMKHPETRSLEPFMATGFFHVQSATSMRRWIEGFAE
jgi:hypothetical protein